jgi:hypothetical protein
VRGLLVECWLLFSTWTFFSLAPSARRRRCGECSRLDNSESAFRCTAAGFAKTPIYLPPVDEFTGKESERERERALLEALGWIFCPTTNNFTSCCCCYERATLLSQHPLLILKPAYGVACIVSTVSRECAVVGWPSLVQRMHALVFSWETHTRRVSLENTISAYRTTAECSLPATLPLFATDLMGWHCNVTAMHGAIRSKPTMNRQNDVVRDRTNWKPERGWTIFLARHDWTYVNYDLLLFLVTFNINRKFQTITWILKGW